MRNRMVVRACSKIPDLLFRLPAAFYFSTSIFVIASILCKCAVEYSFNVNEGWNAFWAAAAWNGADLYPDPASLKLNNYPPLWSFLTGALGKVVGDNIAAGRILAGSALIANAVMVGLVARDITGHPRD